MVIGFGLEERNVQLLVYVSGEASRVWGESVEVLVPRPLLYRYQRGRRSDDAYTVLSSWPLSATELNDVCSGFLLSPSRALRRGPSSSTPRGRVPVGGSDRTAAGIDQLSETYLGLFASKPAVSLGRLERTSTHSGLVGYRAAF